MGGRRAVCSIRTARRDRSCLPCANRVTIVQTTTTAYSSSVSPRATGRRPIASNLPQPTDSRPVPGCRMRDMKRYALRFLNGDLHELREFENEGWACPVCGRIWDLSPPIYPNDGVLGHLAEYSNEMTHDIC